MGCRKNIINSKIKTMVAVTTFYTQDYEELADIIIPNLQKYCLRHGYHLDILKTENGHYHFVKTKQARDLLEKYDIVVAIELDVMITNHSIKIEDWLDEQNSMYITTDVNDANTGVIIIRNTDLGKGLLDMVNKYENTFGDEQMVFENKRIKGVKYCEQPCFNSVPYEYYAPSYGYIGYKEGEVREMPTESMGAWKPTHFCAHLPGMTLERRIEIFTEIKQKYNL